MLKVFNLTKKYGRTIAVKDVSFSLNPGEIGVLAGPNGAGKSTVIKSIAGLLKYEGNILIGGLPNKSIEGKRLLGYIPEIPSLFPLLTISEHITFMAHAYFIKDYEDRKTELLKLFDLWDKKDKYGSELSKGMQQKVSICAALITNPKLLLIDEPMVGLDPKAIRNMKELIIKVKNQGTSVVISTHLLDSVEDIWDKILIMKDGEFILSKSKSELLDKNESLEEIFFQVTEE